MNESRNGEIQPRKSRTQIKHEMIALQGLGGRLAKLSEAQLQRMNLSAELREAVRFAATLKSHGAIRRQLQYIGVLMRDIDSGPIQKALDRIDQASGQDAASFKQIELWRDALAAGDAQVLESILREFPDADRARMNQLVRNARKEKSEGRPPRASRELFRYLRTLCQAGPAGNSDENPSDGEP